MAWRHIIKVSVRVFVLIFTLELLILIGNQIPILKDIEISLLEFDLTDFYTSSQSRLKSFETDTNLVLVNAKWLERDSIGILLSKINNLEPKVMVIDLYFSNLNNSTKDSLLARSLNEQANLIMTAKTYYDSNLCDSIITSHTFFSKNLLIASGMANYQDNRFMVDEYGVSQDEVVRYFLPIDPWACDSLNHISLEVAKLYDSEAHWELLKKGSEFQLINFTGNANSGRFRSYSAHDVINSQLNRLDFTEKIVLIGFLGDTTTSFKNLEGKQITPLNKSLIRRSDKDMYHTELLANIISMVLDKRYLKEASFELTRILNLLSIVLTIILMSYLWLSFNHKNYILRIQSYSTAIILGSLSLILISQFDYKVDFREAIFYAIFISEIFIIYVSYIEPRGINLVMQLRKKIKTRLK